MRKHKNWITYQDTCSITSDNTCKSWLFCTFSVAFHYLRLWTSWNFCFLAQHHWILTTKEGLKAELKWLPSRHTFFSRKRKESQMATGREHCPNPGTVLGAEAGAWFCWMATFQCLSPQQLVQLHPAAACPAPLLGWSPEPCSNSCF